MQPDDRRPASFAHNLGYLCGCRFAGQTQTHWQDQCLQPDDLVREVQGRSAEVNDFDAFLEPVHRLENSHHIRSDTIVAEQVRSRCRQSALFSQDFRYSNLFGRMDRKRDTRRPYTGRTSAPYVRLPAAPPAGPTACAATMLRTDRAPRSCRAGWRSTWRVRPPDSS